MWIEELGREVEIPAGRFVVPAGMVEPGDQAWVREGAGGEWEKTTFYDWWQPVDGFWCVTREWKDDGFGI